MAENRMAGVAGLFGKKLGERFTIVRDNRQMDVKFTVAGLEVSDYYNPYVDLDAFVLIDLLTGEAEIVGDEE